MLSIFCLPLETESLPLPFCKLRYCQSQALFEDLALNLWGCEKILENKVEKNLCLEGFQISSMILASNEGTAVPSGYQTWKGISDSCAFHGDRGIEEWWMGKCLQNLEWPCIKLGKVLPFVLLQKRCFQTLVGIEQTFCSASSSSKILERHFESIPPFWGSLGPKTERSFLSGWVFSPYRSHTRGVLNIQIFSWNQWVWLCLMWDNIFTSDVLKWFRLKFSKLLK